MEIGTALKMTASIVAVMMCAKFPRRTFGDIGVLVLSALSGVGDVGAVTISMAGLGQNGIGADTAVQAIVISVAVNTMSKALLSGWTGGGKVGLLVEGRQCSVTRRRRIGISVGALKYLANTFEFRHGLIAFSSDSNGHRPCDTKPEHC